MHIAYVNNFYTYMYYSQNFENFIHRSNVAQHQAKIRLNQEKKKQQ